MTVGELKDVLEGVDPKMLVILSKDGEGNSYSPLYQCELGTYYAFSKWLGERGGDSDPPALFLIPVT